MHLWQIRQIPDRRQNSLDRNILPVLLILPVCALLAARLTGQDTAESATSPAQAYLSKSVASIRQHQSLQATLLEQVSISERPIRMTGKYLEQGSKTRLELQVKLSGNTRGSLLEVNDGDILWNLTEIGESRQVTLRNLKQISAALDELPALTTTKGRVELGLGGLSGLMGSIERTMDFDQYREESDRDGPQVVIQGKWKPAFLPQLQTNPPQPDAEQKLPAYVPDALRVYFDAATMFPKRFVYLKRQADQTTYRPLVRLEFQDIRLGEAIDESAFQFEPPEGAVPDDVTKQYLEQLQRGKESAGTPDKPRAKE